MDSGAVIALVVETRKGHHEYRHALVGDLVKSPPQARSSAGEWGLAEPIFTCEGERYRIVEVYSPGGDTLEITFRTRVPGLEIAARCVGRSARRASLRGHLPAGR
jgi:hypothetical protein